ncbi:MAG: FG-GAP repeat protein [Phycisphaerales bacterium]|nr:FG-GAP repeat protein [Phycisphaerales bacterium]
MERRPLLEPLLATRGLSRVLERDARSQSWSISTELHALDGQGEDQFGRSTAIDGDTAVVGAPFDDVGNFLNSGSVYVFENRTALGAELHPDSR